MLFSAEWLRIRRTSPLTNTPISADVLIPNHTLKKVIDAWQDSIKEAPLGVPVTPRDEAFDSPHLVEVRGDELEAIKNSVYSAYDSNDEVLLIRRVARVSNAALAGAFERKELAYVRSVRFILTASVECRPIGLATTVSIS